MHQVQMGSITLYGVDRGQDTSPQEAERLAEIAVRGFPGITAALVHRTEGLALVDLQAAMDPRSASRVTGIHFSSARSGGGAEALEATIKILEMFGIGPQSEVRPLLGGGQSQVLYASQRQEPTIFTHSNL